MAPIFCCQFISGLIGEGGVGKSSAPYLATHLTCNRTCANGHPVFFRCKVLIVSLEDSRRNCNAASQQRESTMEFQRKN